MRIYLLLKCCKGKRSLPHLETLRFQTVPSGQVHLSLEPLEMSRNFKPGPRLFTCLLSKRCLVFEVPIFFMISDACSS